MSFEAPWTSIINKVGDVIDDLHMSGEEEWKLRLQQQELDQRGDMAQIEVNKEQARSGSLFVAGPRPAVMWICAGGLAYQYILYPFLLWFWAVAQAATWIPAGVVPPPAMDISLLLSLLLGLLGLSGFRTYEKQKGIDTKSMKKAHP